jgi:hypothetical protein
MHRSLTVQELQCLGLQSFLVIHINAVFQTSLISSDKLAWDHMTSKLSSPLSLSCSDLPELIQAVFHQVTLIAFLLYGMGLSFKHWVYAVLPSHAFILLNYMCCAFFICIVRVFLYWYFIMLSVDVTIQAFNIATGFHCSWFWCLWWVCHSQLITNTEMHCIRVWQESADYRWP